MSSCNQVCLRELGTAVGHMLCQVAAMTVGHVVAGLSRDQVGLQELGMAEGYTLSQVAR